MKKTNRTAAWMLLPVFLIIMTVKTEVAWAETYSSSVTWDSNTSFSGPIVLDGGTQAVPLVVTVKGTVTITQPITIGTFANQSGYVIFRGENNAVLDCQFSDATKSCIQIASKDGTAYTNQYTLIFEDITLKGNGSSKTYERGVLVAAESGYPSQSTLIFKGTTFDNFKTNNNLVSVSTGGTLNIEGLTLTGNTVVNSDGLIYCHENTTIKNLTATNNQCENTSKDPTPVVNIAIGGTAATPLIQNSTITSNTGNQKGGGIAITGISGGKAQITGTTVSSNTAPLGGGFYLKGIEATLDGVTCSGNTASSNGGGIYVDAGATGIIKNSAIQSNTSAGTGGIANYGTLKLNEGAKILANTSTDAASADFAGGVYNKGTLELGSASGTVQITGNTSSATYGAGGLVDADGRTSSSIIGNVQITGNTLTDYLHYNGPKLTISGSLTGSKINFKLAEKSPYSLDTAGILTSGYYATTSKPLSEYFVYQGTRKQSWGSATAASANATKYPYGTDAEIWVRDALPTMSYTFTGQTVTADGQPHSLSATVTTPATGSTVLYGTTEQSCTSSAALFYTAVNNYPIYAYISASGYESVLATATLSIISNVVPTPNTSDEKNYLLDEVEGWMIDAQFQTNGPVNRIEKVCVDGKKISADCYYTQQGEIDLTADFLKTLSEGGHRLYVKFDDGSADTWFDVAGTSDTNPMTGRSVRIKDWDFLSFLLDYLFGVC